MAELKHKLVIDKPPDVVYRALTEQAGLAGWWTVHVTAKPEIGSIAEFSFPPHYHDRMRILKLETNRRAEWECIEGDQEWIGTRFIFDLDPHGGKTILRFTHGNWREPTDFFASCNYIWGTYMTSLKQFCETGSGTPFQAKDTVES